PLHAPLPSANVQQHGYESGHRPPKHLQVERPKKAPEDDPQNGTPRLHLRGHGENDRRLPAHVPEAGSTPDSMRFRRSRARRLASCTFLRRSPARSGGSRFGAFWNRPGHGFGFRFFSDATNTRRTSSNRCASSVQTGGRFVNKTYTRR